jgi:flavorubredoxin
MWHAIGLLSSVASPKKKAAVFGSYGWGGEALKLVADRLSGMKLKVFEENYRARLVPSADEEAELREYCDRLADWVG